MMEVLKGVVMELQDCALTLLKGLFFFSLTSENTPLLGSKAMETVKSLLTAFFPSSVFCMQT